MPYINKAQDMRPTLSDTVDFLNNDLDSDIDAKVDAETQRAVKAESGLSAKITAEEKRAKTEEASITAHLEAYEEETNAKFPALAGTGLTYDSSTGKLNGVQADDITLGMVKLTHEVSHQDAEEYAITADGVASYAPSKAETIDQPTDTAFTDIVAGVTLTVMNATRIGGLVAMGIRIVTDANTTVSAATRIAKCPAGLFKGIANAVASDGSMVMQVDSVGISCNKSIEPSKTLYFQVIGFYNG